MKKALLRSLVLALGVALVTSAALAKKNDSGLGSYSKTATWGEVLGMDNLNSPNAPLDQGGLNASAAANTVTLGSYKFDSGATCTAQGWTTVDITAPTGTYWHVDDFALNNILGSMPGGQSAGGITFNQIQGAKLKGRRVNVITFSVVEDGVNLPTQRRRTTLEAVLLAVLPKRFDPNFASTTDIMALLRRSGYYYANPGEFFAAAIRDFSQYLLVGAGLAVALVILDMPIAAIPILAIYVVLGLRRPYARLKKIAKKREDAMKNNMLLGLSVLESLLRVSTSAQQAFTQTAQIGGPFCNLLALLSAQISKLPPEDAVAVGKAHLPDPRDVEGPVPLP